MVKSQFLALLVIAGVVSGANAGTIQCQSLTGVLQISGSAGVSYKGPERASLRLSHGGASIRLDTTTPLADDTLLSAVVSFKRHGPDGLPSSYSVTFKRTSEDGEGRVSNTVVFALRSVPGTFKRLKEDVFAFSASVSTEEAAHPVIREGLPFESDLQGYVNARGSLDVTVHCVLDLNY